MFPVAVLQSNSNVGGKPLLSNRSIFRVCLLLSHYFSFQTGRVFLQCFSFECFSYAEKVYGLSSSIQNIIQLQDMIQLILILTYWFANQYLNSKEHFVFKIIGALNVKSELVIFRKENMMTWAGPAITTTANRYPFLVYRVSLVSFVTCSDCTWQSLNTSNKRGWGEVFWKQLRTLSLHTCILYITITISVMFPDLPQSSTTQVYCHVC